MLQVLFIAGLLILFGGLWSSYNSLVRVRNFCKDAWADVETELRRRYDLIPNLASVVEGYAAHERGLMEDVTRLREACGAKEGSVDVQANAENDFAQGLKTLVFRLEAYPDLKANQNFLKLQEELVQTEDRIQAARRLYNGNVRRNNDLVQAFPTNFIASVFGFKEREFFELKDSAAYEVPRVGA